MPISVVRYVLDKAEYLSLKFSLLSTLAPKEKIVTRQRVNYFLSLCFFNALHSGKMSQSTLSFSFFLMDNDDEIPKRLF